MNSIQYKRTRFACFFTNFTMTPVFILPPVLFVTFRQMYGISYTLLGTLVLVNFCTQLGVDLLFTFFSRFFNLKNVLRTMPLLTAVGLLIYALVPMLLPQYAYGGLLLGTFIFSVSAGLCEVLLSPTVAALPSTSPERDISTLHSLYGYGATAVILISTGFLRLFGTQNWIYLTLLFAVPSLISFVLLCLSPLPEIRIAYNKPACKTARKNTGLALCALFIFLGSAAENTMTNWIPVFMENTLRLPKMAADTLGLASFTLLLAITRTVYARYGKNIFSMLLWGTVGAVICYLIASLSPYRYLSIFACMFAGICTSMLWPGTLIYMEEKYPHPGVAAYALMAAGGDFGASVVPQCLGVIADAVSASDWAKQLGETFSLSSEQIGMKIGMAVTAIFPFWGVALLLYMKKFFSKNA